MSLPKYLHSNMTGAPTIYAVNGSTNALLLACLVNGFNTVTPTSAAASGGVVTLNYSVAPGFEVGATITVAGATNVLYNGDFRVLTTGTVTTVSNAAAPNGAVAGTLSTKYAALGWTRPYSGANLGAYRQGGSASHKRYLRVYDGAVTTTQRASVRGYEAMTAISTGTGPFPTTTESAGNGVEVLPAYADGSTTNAVPWVVVGTPRAFYVIVGYSAVSGDKDPLLHAGAWGSLGFGELGGATVGDTYAYFCPSDYGWPMSAAWGSRNFSGAPGSRTDLYTSVGPSGNMNTAWTYPDPNLTGFVITPAAMTYQRDIATGQYAFRGYMPGMALAHHQLLAPGSGLNEAQILTSIPGVTGRLILMTGYASTVGYLLKLDEDWGDI